ncbi:probable URB1 Nucleolar protein required for the normal accumulation of 25S and 5.8S rRNAs [Phialocephala subalpina]|uniref:Probable URB1 Nucleolar protein required for the normal accumulation of 25S and 5.8S rRNAs n=1 Tax=Phialocephala subalpina TaxID=576137 RepID=A0A1L7XEB8_9HELO|nr:probable URB1 Nucleolar protein required for the normal accumulation of 25S and 5.8S rRNAs [Phialocephala subalpina]
MTKRPAEEVADGNEAYLKRQNITPVSKQIQTEEIRSARKLRQILAFDQDASRSKYGIQTFKTFLDSFADTENDKATRISILKEYLESQKPADDSDKDAIYLTDLMQTWSFAAQSNDESLLSAVPAVLALLLRTISSALELSEYGLRLGRTVLQKRQEELISRNLAANKSKGFLISPALRLLRELCLFDGGVLARQIFQKRDHTLKVLGRNLSLRYDSDGVEYLKKPSVRTNALRLLLAMIKFLPAESKRELLNQRDIIYAVTRDIGDDPPFMVRDTLETLKSHVLLDEALPRDAKIKIVNATSLGRIVRLYQYNQEEQDPPSGAKSIDTLAHEFLTLACTSPNMGVLTRQSGFYPRGIDPDEVQDLDVEGSSINLGLDSIDWMERFTEKVPVRNTVLSEFIQNLRPWSNPKESDLLVTILRSAPELTADYFFGKKNFSFDPKLTATWMGYSALIYSTLELPIPTFFGHQERYARLPPPPAIVLENILPQPLNQKALVRCFTYPQNALITFFGTRILCVAFQKLQSVLKMYQEAANETSSRLWTQAAERLTDDFCLRCPPIKEVIVAFRRMTSDDLMQKEAITKLLVLYYEIVPRIALEAKFGVSAALADSLQALEDPSLTGQNRALRFLELEHLFEFAHFSSGMRWFSKTEGASVTPFMGMLKLAAEAPADLPLLKIRAVLSSIVGENQIFQTQTSISALETFIIRLRAFNGSPASSSLYTFLDDCISRCAARPIKYLFALEELSGKLSIQEQHPIGSLLMLVIAEQWPYLIKSTDDAALQEIARFLAEWLAASIKIKEDKQIIKALIQNLAAELPETSSARKTISKTRKLVDELPISEPKAAPSESAKITDPEASSISGKAEILAILTEDPDAWSEEHGALVKWTTKEIDEVIEDGHAKALIVLLSSEHLSVRKEALTNLSKFAVKLKASTFEEKEQIWLLLCELVETARPTIDQEPLPSFISAFASNAIALLKDPLHVMYGKMNKFLSRGPTWQVDKLPLMHKVLDEKPTLDDAHHLEVSWLLDYMLTGLRTEADMAIYRKRLLFEKLLSLYNSSTMTWLQAQAALGGGISVQVLMDQLVASCDQERIGNWKKGINMAKDKS